MRSADVINRAIVLVRRPNGELAGNEFELRESPVPELADGEVLTRTLWLSIDPYMRSRLNDTKSYAQPVAIGGVMTGESVSEVVASRSPALAPGDVVVGTRGWQTHNVARASSLLKVDADGVSPSTFLGVLGMPGVTAYSGLTDIGQPKPGETLVVSAASGAVGSVVGQLAKRAGARAVGIAGGPEKCRFVTEELGFDACVDHRSPNFRAELKAASPDGIDVYFENVGGIVQAEVFHLLNNFARVPMCGSIADYHGTGPGTGPALAFTIGKRVRMEGFIVSDKPERFPEWRRFATPLVRDGSLKYKEDVFTGIEHAPDALAAVLAGRNFGKCLVDVRG